MANLINPEALTSMYGMWVVVSIPNRGSHIRYIIYVLKALKKPQTLEN